MIRFHGACVWTIACGMLAVNAGLPGRLLAQTDLPRELVEFENRKIQVIAAARAATVCIFATDGNGGGSGVLVTPDGFALTNFHVVQPCGAFMKCGLSNGNVYDAVVVGIDPVGDVALIKLLTDEPLPVARLGDSDLVRCGQECFACGNPFLLATDFQPTVTWGLISGVHRYQYPDGTLLEYSDCLQTDAAINPGNSGGPLFNDQGDVIGINGRCSFEKRGRVNVGVGYAISANQVKRFFEHLKVGRIVDHATLGATVSTSSEGIVRVSNLLENSDAFRQGLRYDDELVQFGNQSITSTNQFKNILGTYPEGWRVPIRYRRSNQDVEIVVRLASLHASEELLDLVDGMAEQPEALPDGKSKSKESVPTAVSGLFQKRRGFANYYFNRLEQERIWARFVEATQIPLAAQKWTMNGKSKDGQVVQAILDEDQSGLRLGESFEILDRDQPLAEQLGLSNTRTALLALRLWHRLQTKGIYSYGDVAAFGRIPLSAGNAVQFDVLIGTTDGLEAWFYFEATTGVLGLIEMESNGGGFIKLIFDSYREMAGIRIPGSIRCEMSDRPAWEFQVDSLERTDKK